MACVAASASGRSEPIGQGVDRSAGKLAFQPIDAEHCQSLMRASSDVSTAVLPREEALRRRWSWRDSSRRRFFLETELQSTSYLAGRRHGSPYGSPKGAYSPSVPSAAC